MDHCVAKPSLWDRLQSIFQPIRLQRCRKVKPMITVFAVKLNNRIGRFFSHQIEEPLRAFKWNGWILFSMENESWRQLQSSGSSEILNPVHREEIVFWPEELYQSTILKYRERQPKTIWRICSRNRSERGCGSHGWNVFFNNAIRKVGHSKDM